MCFLGHGTFQTRVPTTGWAWGRPKQPSPKSLWESPSLPGPHSAPCRQRNQIWRTLSASRHLQHLWGLARLL